MKKQHLDFLIFILFSAIAVNFFYYINQDVTINFYAHPDKLNIMSGIIESFENEHPNISINYVQLPDDTNDKYEIISSKLALQNGTIDVIDSDITWPSIFVKAGWVADLTEYISEEERSLYLSSAIDAATVAEKIYGIPYRMDSGVLFYRKDLLEKYNQPVPETYEELTTISKLIMAQEKNLFGFAASWKNFEGLSCHFFEILWSGGFDFDTTHTPYTFDEKGMTDTLQSMQNMIYLDNIVSKEVTTYSSGDLRAAFIEGNLLFMRDWPTGWKKLSSEPKLNGKIGIASLPSLKAGNPSYGTLGGWMYMVSDASKHKKEAVEWIKFLTTIENEKLMNLNYNYLPSRKELYYDNDVLEQLPFLSEMSIYFNRSKPRPKISNYDALSLLIQEQVHTTLQNEQTPSETVIMMKLLLNKLTY